HRQLLAHVDLVDEHGQVDDRFAVQHASRAGPGSVGRDRRLGDRRARAGEAALIVVTGDAGADVVTDAVVELAGPELAGTAADGAKRGVALEAGVDVDALVPPGDV